MCTRTQGLGEKHSTDITY